MFYVLGAYFIVALCLGVYLSIKSPWYDFPEDFYTLLGFSLCWPFSVPHQAWSERHHRPGYIDEVNGTVKHTQCIHCGDVRIIFSDFKSATKGYLSPRWWQFCDGIQAEVTVCPYCGKELPPNG